MDSTQAQLIIEEVIQGLFNRWKPQEYELRSWIAELRKYDYDKARKAITVLFFRLGTRNVDPPAGKIIDTLKEYASIPHAEPETVLTSFYVQCAEAPARNPRLLGAKRGVFAADLRNQNDPDYMLKASATMRSKYEALYGGRWIIVQEPETDEGTVYGPDAKLKAEVDILTGPDCPTKNWLEAHKEKLFKTADLLKDASFDNNNRFEEAKKQTEELLK